MTGNQFPNEVQPFSIEGANVRGRLVRLGQAFDDILSSHNYPEPVGGLMGELTAMTAALADSLKYDGLFILQTQSDGPVSMMVVDVTSDGTIRGYARYDKDRFYRDTEINTAVPHIMGSGHIAFTVDQGLDTERYQGITTLEGASLAECAQSYFRRSEQLETALLLAADSTTRHATALMIQKMPMTGKGAEQHRNLTPEEDDESWRSAVILMSSMMTAELLDPGLSSLDLLYRLYHETGVRIYTSKPLKFQCRCTEEKISATLASFSPDDLADMKTAEGLIVTTCEFCLTEYNFDDDALAALRALNSPG
ncbi:MAG: Hsp33 family molecular chaperone HslO [Rhodospirillales bacterium]|nr:Hsp33 family molecular chaperone HslO [Rhodospirillales bacterium]